MLRTVADQPTFWERFLLKELRRLSMELARVDALLDDRVFFAPFERFFDPRRVGRPSTPRANPQPRRIRHHQAHRRRPKSWGSRASWWRRNPMARVMARPRRAVTQKHDGIAKGP